MTFKEAYESNRTFKRKDWDAWHDRFTLIQIYPSDAIADDWILQDEPKKKVKYLAYIGSNDNLYLIRADGPGVKWLGCRRFPHLDCEVEE